MQPAKDSYPECTGLPRLMTENKSPDLKAEETWTDASLRRTGGWPESIWNDLQRDWLHRDVHRSRSEFVHTPVERLTKVFRQPQVLVSTGSRDSCAMLGFSTVQTAWRFLTKLNSHKRGARWPQSWVFTLEKQKLMFKKNCAQMLIGLSIVAQNRLQCATAIRGIIYTQQPRGLAVDHRTPRVHLQARCPGNRDFASVLRQHSQKTDPGDGRTQRGWLLGMGGYAYEAPWVGLGLLDCSACVMMIMGIFVPKFTELNTVHFTVIFKKW